MVKRCLSDLKGDFLHVHKSDTKQGIISNILQNGGNCDNLKSGKISNIYQRITQHEHNCLHCQNKLFNMSGGAETNDKILDKYKFVNDFDKFNNKMIGGKHNIHKKVYVENKDICFVGTRVKLVNPHIVTIAGKKVAFNYKSIVRKCNKHEHKIKHKNN